MVYFQCHLLDFNNTKFPALSLNYDPSVCQARRTTLSLSLSMRPLPKVRACLALNVALLTAVFGCAVAFASDTPYFRWGPHADLVVVSVVVDTPGRYAALLALLAAAGVVKVVVSEIGEPVLIFNVYNPDKAVITDFSRAQLLVYANLFFLVSNARRVFEVLVTVTQIDIALFAVLTEQLASIAVVSFLVCEKRFDPDGALVTA